MTRRTAVLSFLVVATLAGCKSFDGDKVRREHAEYYPENLAKVTAAVLAEQGPLGLEDCLRIALERSLDTQTAEIRQRIAKLDRKIAFANFLPAVTVDYMHYEFDPEISLELDDTTLNIDKLRTVTWEANASIFNPATWFLYTLHKRGEEIAALVTDYTKQMTVLQVTLLYYHCLSLEEMERALESEVAAAVALDKELRALYTEGLVSEWQADQAQVQVQARRIERNRMGRNLAEARADLLAAMGLSPLANLSLKAETPLEPPCGTLDQLIFEALLAHPELKIADRQIEIQEEQVKIAFTNFLPKLFGFVMYPDMLEDFVSTSDQWTYGLSGTMTLFNGFANINEYKAARERRSESFLAREQASLALMLEVVSAHLALQTAAEQETLARRISDVAVKRFTETQNQWREGLVNASALLDAMSEREKARVQAISARFQYQVTTATLLNVMGQTQIDYEEPEHDGAS